MLTFQLFSVVCLSEMEESKPLLSNVWRGSTQTVRSKEEDFRRKIKYFFMNPCEKYRATGRLPWKMMLQILKIALITAQLVSFGLSNEMMVTFKEENLMTFKHLFLKGFKDHRRGSYALYSKTDVYDHISYTINRFTNLPNLTVGNLTYAKNDLHFKPLSICRVFYTNSSINPGNDTLKFDPHTKQDCISIYPMQLLHNFSVPESNLSIDFIRLQSVTIYLHLKTINLQSVRHHELPDCYEFDIKIMFDNRAHSGKINIDVKTDAKILECRDWYVKGSYGKINVLILSFDFVVMLVCLSSLILCMRSLINGIKLQSEFNIFFQTRYNKIVTWSDRMEFVNGWYILIIVSDTLTIVGSVIKIGIQTKLLTCYDVCSILLGTATLLVWVGVIRYLGYFKKYNILILTLRAAFPNVIRFCCCAAMIYLGYCFCGWIVIGPYHDKFRTPDKVSESLFSLISGDDIYAAFMKLKDKSFMVWLFSRLYLYSFACIFIYMVLSLFIALITDTYETIKHHQKDKKPKSQLHLFIAENQNWRESERHLTSKRNSTCCVSPSG